MAETRRQTHLDEYADWKSGRVKPSTTRGVVVSNVDPLFAGRVKVWIPAIHGPSPYDQYGNLNIDPDIQDYSSSLKIVGSSTFKDQKTVDGLPWASVLSHNMGPISDLQSGITSSAGVFSTPAIGSEVILMFENNDHMLPVVVGSIIHANEFRYSLPRPLEMLPGVALSSVSQIDIENNKAAATPVDDSAYPLLASQVYNIKTSLGSTLFISDDPNNRSIVLEGSVAYDKISVLTQEDVLTLSRLYPAFPTTASAPFAKREPLSAISPTPLLAPNNALGSDFVSGSSVIRLTPSAASSIQASAVSGVVADAINTQKSKGTANKTAPVGSSFKSPSGRQVFRSRRPESPNGVHSGIDISTPGTVSCIAPIDCFPLYVSNYVQDVGYFLMVLGIDGWAHAFVHLRSIEGNIQKIINSGNPQLVPLGTKLGICGITQETSHSSGAHLHWDVWNAGVIAQTGPAIQQSRNRAISNSQTVDGLKTWLHSNSNIVNSGKNNTISVTVTATPEQMSTIYTDYSVSYSSEDAVNFAKPAGLEMSLTPGKETITLRHPSGSYIGFDPDGNILIYSCGDVNFRVNRSITYDVLGVIMESCYAKYSRVKTVIKKYARMYFNYKAKDQADSSMPDFFSRVDICRAYDMQNALTSTVNNSFIIDSSGNQVNPTTLPAASTGKPYNYPPMQAVVDDTITKYDTILQNLFNTYISVDETVSKLFPDFTYFKAIMLLESNGVSSQKGGLFGLTDTMFKAVGKSVPSNSQMGGYVGNTELVYKNNADIAFQYIRILSVKLTNFIAPLKMPANVSTQDLRNLVLLAYVYGEANTEKYITSVKATLSASGQDTPTLTYEAVETACMGAILAPSGNNSNNPILSFVPTIDVIVNKLKKSK